MINKFTCTERHSQKFSKEKEIRRKTRENKNVCSIFILFCGSSSLYFFISMSENQYLWIHLSWYFTGLKGSQTMDNDYSKRIQQFSSVVLTAIIISDRIQRSRNAKWQVRMYSQPEKVIPMPDAAAGGV